jgi:hypothetical protein
MTKGIVILLIFSALNCDGQFKKQTSFLEDKILDTVLSLPEVKKEANKVEQLSHNKRHLSDVIYQRSEKSFNYYWVKVWEDNGDAYVTYFHFYVNPKTLEIKFYDVVNDKLVDLKIWRKLHKKNQ